jgi:hypothetical protein
MVKDDVLERVKRLLAHGTLKHTSELAALDALGTEFKSAKRIGEPTMRKHVKETKKVKRHGFGSGVSNFEALGHKIKDDITIGKYAKNHADCIIMIKDGIAKRMDDTNEEVGGHGKIAVVYRTGSNSDN